MGAVIAVPITLVCLAVWLALPRLGFHPEVLPPLRDYFAVILWSTLPLLLYAAVRRYLQGIHAVVPVAFALVTANLVNVAGNYVLINGAFGFPRFGIEAEGASWESRRLQAAFTFPDGRALNGAAIGAAVSPIDVAGHRLAYQSVAPGGSLTLS